MPSVRTLRFLTVLVGLGLCASVVHAQTAAAYSVAFPNNIIAGISATFTVSLVYGTGKTVQGNGQTATIAVAGVATNSAPGSVTFTSGKTATATIQLMFTGTGIATLTVTDTTMPAPAPPLLKFNASITVSSVQSICAECYASIGIGTAMTPEAVSDYSNSSNILTSNQVGSSTPQYLVGVSFQIPIPGVRYTHLVCYPSDYAAASPKSTYCYPWKAFVNLNLSTTTNQTLSGYTFGLSHSLTSHLDLMA